MCHSPDSSIRLAHDGVGEQPATPQAVSPLRFEIKPGVLAIHGKALVVIERLEGSHVNVRDLVTGAMLTVLGEQA
jgi:hypothetical protein